jgi:hypothetical protein
MREPDAHPVGSVGAVEYENAVGHDRTVSRPPGARPGATTKLTSLLETVAFVI